jgi:hypothetical protein
MTRGERMWLRLILFGLLSLAPGALAQEMPEYRLKAAFLYNFVLFTEWPAEVGSKLNLCIHGQDPFGKEIDALQGKAAGARSIAVQRRRAGESLKGCHIVFVAASAIGTLPSVLADLGDGAVLTVADSPGAALQGVALGMTVVQNKITFDANLQAARAGRVALSSKLLRLAAEVYR